MCMKDTVEEKRACLHFANSKSLRHTHAITFSTEEFMPIFTAN